MKKNKMVCFVEWLKYDVPHYLSVPFRWLWEQRPSARLRREIQEHSYQEWREGFGDDEPGFGDVWVPPATGKEVNNDKKGRT